MLYIYIYKYIYIPKVSHNVSVPVSSSLFQARAVARPPICAILSAQLVSLLSRHLLHRFEFPLWFGISITYLLPWKCLILKHRHRCLGLILPWLTMYMTSCAVDNLFISPSLILGYPVQSRIKDIENAIAILKPSPHHLWKCHCCRINVMLWPFCWMFIAFLWIYIAAITASPPPDVDSSAFDGFLLRWDCTKVNHNNFLFARLLCKNR